MNCKEQHLPELELSTGQVREALQCILHTILFIRSPGPVAPEDVECEGFDITYTRISSGDNHHKNHPHPNRPHHHHFDPSSSPSHNNHHISTTNSNDIDRKVDDAIEAFLKSLSQIGPELLSGRLTLSFFERRASRQLFGLVSHEERVVWEQWVLRVVVNNTPRPISNDSAAVIERQRIQDTAEGMLRTVLLKIFEVAGESLDHIPPVMYDWACHTSTGQADDRENMYSRVSTMPPIFNLAN
mmetsp:Transcript_8902/g.17793  ORF Transcript_8902/g.17793 Transcript_8902/m.17793 type:complete len:242 (-) Transcript_8902:3-728(-)